MKMYEPSEDEFSMLHAVFSRMTTIPAEEWNKFKSLLKAAQVAKGDCLVRPGGDSDLIAFVLKGVFKIFYTTYEGKEFIRNFGAESSFAAAYSSLLLGTASNVTIQAMEESKVLLFSYAQYRSLLKRHFCWQEVSRLIAEKHYILRENRQYDLLALEAKERFQKFFMDFPELKNRISQIDIANYLGITPVSLSRIRSQMSKSKKATKSPLKK